MLKRKFTYENSEIKQKHIDSINDVDKLVSLIIENSSINWQYSSYDDCTIIMILYKLDNFETFKILLDLNPDITIKNKFNKTIINYIIDTNRIIDIFYLNNSIKNKYIKYIFDVIDINIILSSQFRELIHYAIKYEFNDLLKKAIENNIDINYIDNNDKNSLHIACECRNYEIVKLIINFTKIDVNSKDKYMRTPLYLLFSRDFNFNNENIMPIFSLLIDISILNVSDNHNTLLKVTCLPCYIEYFMKILKKGVDLNYGTMCNKYNIFINLIKEFDIEILKQYLEYKPDINVYNSDNDTLLHYCVQKRKFEVFKLLLGLKPNIEFINKNNESILLLCCKLKRYNYIDHLLNIVDINMCDNHGNTVIHCIAHLKDLDYFCNIYKKFSNDTLRKTNKEGNTIFFIAKKKHDLIKKIKRKIRMTPIMS
jgi:ankyrin repeat protein